MGKSSLEDAILIEIEKLLEDFKKYEGKPTAIPYSLTLAILNIIWQITAGKLWTISVFELRNNYYFLGKTFDLNDQKLIKVEKLVTAIFTGAQAPGVIFYDVFPFFYKSVPHFLKRKLGLEEHFRTAEQFRYFLQVILELKPELLFQNFHSRTQLMTIRKPWMKMLRITLVNF